MFCKNCGTKVDSGAKFCINCGAAIKKDVSENNIVSEPEVKNAPKEVVHQVQKNSSGIATASLVLGIIGISIGVIMFIIFMLYYAYNMQVQSSNIRDYMYYDSNSRMYETLYGAIGMMLLPGLLSLIGLPLGIFAKSKFNKGSKIAGIILNTITIVLCAIAIVLPFITMK